MTDTAAPIQGKGKRRPVDDDLAPLLQLIGDGASLTAACKERGLDTPSTYHWLHEDAARSQRYRAGVGAREDLLAEEGLIITKAAALGIEYQGKKIDPAGAKVYLSALQWMSGRMKPKTERLSINHTFGALDDDALDAEIKRAEREAAGIGEEES